MTNTGDIEGPQTPDAAFIAEIEAALAGVPIEISDKYVSVAAAPDGHYDQPARVFDLLAKIRHSSRQSGRGFLLINLAAVSKHDVATLEAIGDVVRNGLVEQRNYHAGSRKGRSTLTMTAAGNELYKEAKAAAKFAAAQTFLNG